MPPVALSAEQAILTLADFSGGEFSTLGRWKASADQFTGSNMMLYADGALGPRNGCKEVALTGTTPAGVVLGLGYNNAADAAGYKDTWFIIGSTAYVFDRDTGACASAGSVVTTPTSPPQMVERATDSFVSIPGGGLARITHGAVPAVAVIASPDSPGMTCFTIYGERYVAGGGGKAPDGSTSPGNRLYYSAAADPEDWDEATSTSDSPPGYIDVGDSASITALIPQRTHLLICKGGEGGQWWILTGTPGVNETLRPIQIAVSPAAPNHAAVLGDGNVGYALGSSATGSIGSLGIFTGSRGDLHPTLQFGAGRSGTAPTFSVRKLKESMDWFVQGGKDNAPNALALFCRGAWTLHTWGIGSTLTGFCSSFTTADFHLFTDGGAGGAVPKFYRWAAYANRPAFVSDGGAQPGDASVTPLIASFSTAEFHAPEGAELYVKAVTVDFRAWNTGSATSNHFEVKVTPTRVYNTGDAAASATSAWDEAAASASTSGSRRRMKMELGDQVRGDGFFLTFTNVRGVAIERIQIHVDQAPAVI